MNTANALSELHWKFIQFAGGMPAIGISWSQVKLDVDRVAKSLAGVEPAQPSPLMANMRMPVYQLAYSVFVRRLTLAPRGSICEMETQMLVNVHTLSHPELVIRSYTVETATPANVSLGFDNAANEVFWQEQGSSQPKITPAWGSDADRVLSMTTIPDPKRDHYLDEVERQIIWLTGPSFVRLVADILPRYRLSEIVPWLRLHAPLRVDVTSPHIVITASRATVTVGNCSPETTEIVPDPAFPYGESIPRPTLSSGQVDLAVYAPRTRLFDFYAKALEPAVLVAVRGGGAIKWALAGSVGLNKLSLSVSTAQGTSGVLGIAAIIDFVAAAQAWFDGPCGIRLSLASASVIGSGDFSGELQINLDWGAQLVEAVLVVTKSDLPNPSFDVSTPLPWPLDQIAGEILRHVTQDEARKLAGSAVRLGRWHVVGLPLEYLDTVKPAELSAHSEGWKSVSAFTGVWRRKG